MTRRTLFTAGLALALLLGAAGRARAHAGLVRTYPAMNARLDGSPAQIVLWFDEELDTQASHFALIDHQTGAVSERAGRVDLTDPDHARLIMESVPSLLEGVYSVRWRAVSFDDGFAAEGEFHFIIGNAAPPVTPTPSALATLPPSQPSPASNAPLAALAADPVRAASLSEGRAWSPLVVAAGVMLAVVLLLVLKGDRR